MENISHWPQYWRGWGGGANICFSLPCSVLIASDQIHNNLCLRVLLSESIITLALIPSAWPQLPIGLPPFWLHSCVAALGSNHTNLLLSRTVCACLALTRTDPQRYNVYSWSFTCSHQNNKTVAADICPCSQSCLSPLKQCRPIIAL